MTGKAISAVIAIGLLAGCQSSRDASGSAPAEFKPNRDKSVEITPAADEFAQRRAQVRSQPKSSGATATGLLEGEVITLPKFVVTEKGFAKFGLSVVTNTEVALGGRIEWMQVGVVIPGGRAAQQGLFTGLQILAIDGVVVTAITRDDMLHALFERTAGEHVRLLVYSRAFGPLPRFVILDSKSLSPK